MICGRNCYAMVYRFWFCFYELCYLEQLTYYLNTCLDNYIITLHHQFKFAEAVSSLSASTVMLSDILSDFEEHRLVNKKKLYDNKICIHGSSF